MTAESQASSLRVIETGRADTVGFEIDGPLTARDLHDFAERMNKLIADGKAKRMIGRFLRYKGFEVGALFDSEYIAMKLGLLGSLERYAIVGAPAWLALAIRLLDPLLRIEVRHFTLEEEPLAWDWVKADPQPSSALIA